jgi:hypothetical protein
MARTELTPTTPKGPYPALPPAADSLDFAWAAADVANKNQFTSSGRDLLLVNNTGASAYTVTITSIADALGRTGDISAYSLAAGDFAVFWVGAQAGWQQTDGKVYLEANNAAVKFAIVRIP